MSEIPYYFETPIPKYFRENGWFKNENSYKFITWAFSKCQSVAHKVVINSKEIMLAPFEFIAGRLTSPKECFLTEDAYRHQLKVMLDAGFLKKTPNSAPNKYTCYIWVTARFSKSNPQLNPQLAPNWPPTGPHKSEDKKKRSKEYHHPSPSSNGADERGIDDSFSYSSEDEEKIELITGIFLSQSVIDECIQIKGSLESVKHAMAFIQGSSRRKYEINDWIHALTTWKIPQEVKSVFAVNEKFAKKLADQFDNFTDAGFCCRIETHKEKDSRGLFFYSSSPYLKPFFFSFADRDFEKNVTDFMESKNMQLSNT